MAKHPYMSAINPIRFFEHYKIPKDGYMQKFANTDDTYIQIISDGSTFDLRVLNEQGADVTVINSIQQSSITLAGKTFVTFKILFAGLKGIYQLRLIETRGEKQYFYYSMFICVSPDNTKLTKLQYKNTFNRDDIKYRETTLSEGVDIFTIRTEGGFQEKNYIPKSNDTIYMKGDYRFHLLHSLAYYTRQFTIGDTFGISDELFYTINNVFSCDTVYINDEGYTKFEGASFAPTEIDHYALRTWNIELAPTGDNLERDEQCASLFCTGFLHPNQYLFNNSFLKVS